MDQAAAEALADKILDWRERGEGKRLNGAKMDDYRAAGFAYGPREGPFPNVAELKLVMSMTPRIYENLARIMTVWSRNQTVDTTVAPREVLLVLSATGQTRVDQITEARRSVTGIGRPGVFASRARNFVGHALTVVAKVVGNEGTIVARTTVIRLTGRGAEPYWIYRWS
jgi:general secretion pathway protein K